MAWPKIIEIAGMKVPVDSWAELREAYAEFSGDVRLADEGRPAQPPRGESPLGPLNHSDRALLTQFVTADERGLLTSQLAQALGKKGKGVRPALEKWSRRIGLVTENNTTAFEAVKRFDGRGFRLLDHYRQTAMFILGLS